MRRKQELKVVADPTLVLTHRATRTREQWTGVNFSYGKGDAGFYAKHARLGDPWAQRHLALILVRRAVRGSAKAFLRRLPNNDWTYLTGFRQGLEDSRAYAVDKNTRLYTLAQTAPGPDTKPAAA